MRPHRIAHCGKSEEQFVREIGVHDGVQWNFAVIGEALSRLRRIDSDTYGRITDSNKIVGFRNQLLHGYAVIDDTITWQILRKDFPLLVNEIGLLLREPDRSLPADFDPGSPPSC
jgi:uncharacterized protein with HEPN domain